MTQDTDAPAASGTDPATDPTASLASDASDEADSPFAAVASADVLETVLDALASLVDECVIRADDEGLCVEAMDPATVAMVSLTLDADAFEAYDADDVRLGVRLDRLRNVVGMADSGQPVRLALDPETRTLHVRVGQLAYTLALVDPDAIRSPPDRVDLADQYAATVEPPAAAVSQAIDAADMVSDHLELGVADDHLYARADGDTDTVAVDVPADDCEAFEGERVDSLFSLQYLACAERALPADQHVRVRLGDEAPVEVRFDVADGAGAVTYVVSPRLRRD